VSEAILIDGIVIILLGATIYVAYRLDRRLQSVRSVQHELAGVIRDLNIAAARAEAGLQGLKLAAQSSGEELEAQIRNARAAGDELARLLKSTERAGRIAPVARMETRVDVRPSDVPLPKPVAETRQPSALDALRSLSASR
jgi:hypothetical protein